MIMNCPNCKREIPNEAKFCLHCGVKIEVDASTIECPSCHARIPKDSKFCPDCGVPKTNSIDPIKQFTINNLSFNMILVEGGTFPSTWPKEHVASVKSFYCAQTQVTQELWQSIVGNNPSTHKGAKHPVDSVSWFDCHNFINLLNIKIGSSFRLLTVEEWEFAAKGGNYANKSLFLSRQKRGKDATYKASYPVGQDTPNAIGLCDMYDELFEWSQNSVDRKGNTITTFTKDLQMWPFRKICGLLYSPVEFRGEVTEPTVHYADLTFRLALDV